MLDTFRKRDNPRDNPRENPRPTTPGAALMRTPGQPPLRAPEAPRVEAAPEAASALPIQVDASKATTPTEEVARELAPLPRNAREAARLTVGPDIKLKGAEITDCDTLIVEGQVDACMDSRVIEVAERGIFHGKVHVDIAEIRGRFEGELTAHKQLMIRATGTVTGKIRYGTLLVDTGGEISGDVAAGDPMVAQVRAQQVAPTEHAPNRTSEAQRPLEVASLPAAPYRAPSAAGQR